MCINSSPEELYHVGTINIRISQIRGLQHTDANINLPKFMGPRGCKQEAGFYLSALTGEFMHLRTVLHSYPEDKSLEI